MSGTRETEAGRWQREKVQRLRARHQTRSCEVNARLATTARKDGRGVRRRLTDDSHLICSVDTGISSLICFVNEGVAGDVENSYSIVI
jgi:hypothetical protein